MSNLKTGFEGVSIKGSVSVDDSNLNIRSGPGTNYSVIGSLKDGSNIEIYNIKYGSKVGYVSDKYIRISETTTGTVLPSSIELKSETKMNSQTKAELSKNTRVTVLSKGALWSRVKNNGEVVGYTHYKNLEIN